MRVCVLSDEDEQDFDVSPYLIGYDYEFVTVKRPVMDLLKGLKERDEFDLYLNVCEGYDVDLVLAGHSHASRVFDKDKNFYPDEVLPLNCSQYPPLYTQTDACKEGSYYRIITVSGNDVWLNPCEHI